MDNFMNRTIRSVYEFNRGVGSGFNFGSVLLLLNDVSMTSVFRASSIDEVQRHFSEGSYAHGYAKVFFSQINEEGERPSELKIVGNFKKDMVNTLKCVQDDLLEEYYSVSLETELVVDILLVSAWIENQNKALVVQSRDALILDSHTDTDLLSGMMALGGGKGYDRTFVMVSRKPISQEIKIHFSSALVTDQSIDFKAIGSDVHTTYSLSIPEVKFNTSSSQTLSDFKDSLEDVTLKKQGVEMNVFSAVTIQNETLTLKVMEDLKVLITRLVVKGGISAVNVTHEEKTPAVLGQHHKYSHAVFCGNRASRDSGDTTIAYTKAYEYVPDFFTVDELNTMDKKRGNYIVKNAEGVLIYQGISSSGLFFDMIRFGDEINQRIMEAINYKLVHSKKIGFDEIGLGEISSVINQTIIKNGSRGQIDEKSIDIRVKEPWEVTQNEKNERRLEGTKWSFTLNGAIHQLKINGEITP